MSGLGVGNESESDEEESSVSSNEDSGADDTKPLKPKRWSHSVSDVFFNDLCLKTCVEIITFGRTLKQWELHGCVMDIWHRRYKDDTLHKKPEFLKHPTAFIEHSAFASSQEWSDFDSEPVHMGKPSARYPAGGMKKDYHTFAAKIWSKMKILRREIGKSTMAHFNTCVPNGKVPSGTQRSDIVLKMRTLMFADWCVAKSSNKSKVKYLAVEMTGGYAAWEPSWFKTWIEMGPLGTKATQSPVFLLNMCGIKVGIESDDADPSLPAGLTNVFAVAETECKSRQKQKNDAKMTKKAKSSVAAAEDNSKVNSSFSSPVLSTSSSSTIALDLVQLEKRNSLRKERQNEIERLKYLVRRYADTQEYKKLEQAQEQLDTLMETPFAPDGVSVLSSASLNSMRSFSPAITTVSTVSNTTIVPLNLQELISMELPLGDLHSGSTKAFSPIPPVSDAISSMMPVILTTAYEVEQQDAARQAQQHISCMSVDAYLDWLVEKKTLHFVPVIGDGACLFGSALHGIKELYYNCADYRVWGSSPSWEQFSAENLRHHVLKLMEDSLEIQFPQLQPLGFDSFEKMILDEGKEHGIVDHAKRDLGEPPCKYGSCSEYFEMMKSPSTYGNQSCLMGIAIFFKVQFHVWIFRGCAPEIYNPGGKYTVNVFKTDRCSHYDALSHSVRLKFLRHPSEYHYDIDMCEQHGGSGCANCTYCQQGMTDVTYSNGKISKFQPAKSKVVATQSDDAAAPGDVRRVTCAV
jgi:hypothetical protein